jgi:hypothetical protein
MRNTEGRARGARALLAPLLLPVLLWAGGACADELRPFQVSYTWSYRGMTVAASSLDLVRRDSETWVYKSHSEPRGLGRLFSLSPKMESVMRVTDAGGVQPLSYKARAADTPNRRDVSLTFDWEKARVNGVYEGTPVDIPLEAGTQDDLSVQIALMVDLLRGHTPEKLLLIDKNSVREYRYTRENEETLDTPMGKVATVIYKSTKQYSPRATRFWCAPERGFLPMKVEQRVSHDGKESVEWTMQIQSAKRD